MQTNTTKLIDILTKLTTKRGPKVRDLLWAISTRYDYNSRVIYVLEHEGSVYDIADELSPSENEFYSYKDAESKLKEILLGWIENEISGHRLDWQTFREELEMGVLSDPPQFRDEQLNKLEQEAEKYGRG